MGTNVEETIEESRLRENAPCLLSKRWLLAYIAFISFMFVYGVRTDISVAIVCMVIDNKTASTANISDPTCVANANASQGYDRAEFHWNKGEQSGLLSAFYYGYIFAQIPAGWLAGRFGGKYVLGVGWTIAAIATLLTPVGARESIYIVYALRVIVGFFSGVSYPAMQSMWGRWAPPMERSKLISLTFSGSFVGNILTFVISGYLCAEGFDNGWGSIFYVIGAANLLWVIVWFIFVSDSPSDHSSITDEEREYIVKSIGDTTKRVTSTPWREIATSRPLYVCVLSHVCFNWLLYTIMAEVPTFLKKVLLFDVKSNGLLSSAPFMAMAVTSLGGGQVADFLRTHYLSTKVTRRGAQALAFFGASGCLLGTGFVTCSNRYVGVILLCVAVGFMGLCNSGFMVNVVDFAPRYAGVLFGISNLFATIPGMTAPLAVGAFTPNDTQEEWQTVFYICTGFGLVGALVFTFFSEFEVQPWARENVELDLHDMGMDDNPKKMKNGDATKSGVQNEGFVENGTT
ncbi:sialin-like isoform X1 [Haliotis rubra]|uniref:sialin-like isoform X1 n=1 Tax=Haliotis rubra TaxID=36100 RepID=UPI001EE5D3C4|nr:sialin-like isoform X1 [Haliotis rubra]